MLNRCAPVCGHTSFYLLFIEYLSAYFLAVSALSLIRPNMRMDSS